MKKKKIEMLYKKFLQERDKKNSTRKGQKKFYKKGTKN